MLIGSSLKSNNFNFFKNTYIDFFSKYSQTSLLFFETIFMVLKINLKIVFGEYRFKVNLRLVFKIVIENYSFKVNF